MLIYVKYQGFQQGLACWSSSQTQTLWNSKSNIWSFLSALSSRWLQLLLGGKLSRDYTVYVGVPRCSILGPSLFFIIINDLPGDAICNIATYAEVTSLYFNCDQASDLWPRVAFLKGHWTNYWHWWKNLFHILYSYQWLFT